MERDALLKQIRDVVRGIDPGAEIILYGSRARGDARADSDWDLLVLYAGMQDKALEERLSDALYEVELSADEIVMPIIHHKGYWEQPLTQATPFYAEVTRHGVAV